jgi:hypothetical protein
MFFLILAFDEYFKQKEATFAETKPRKRTYSLYLKDFHLVNENLSHSAGRL